MDPIDLTTEDRVQMPPHTAVTYAKDQPQSKDQPRYRPLPTVRFDHDGRILTRWRLSDIERRQVAAGLDLYIQVATFGDPLQPLLPTIGCPEFCPADIATKAES